jgi:hypothetical protein
MPNPPDDFDYAGALGKAIADQALASGADDPEQKFIDSLREHAKPKDNSWDVTKSFKAGLYDVPKTAAALADIPVAALTSVASGLTDAFVPHAADWLDQPWASKAADWMGDTINWHPHQTAEKIRSTLSPEHFRVAEEKQQAWDEGRYGDYLATIAANPYDTIGNLIAESLPSTIAGGVVGRGLSWIGALKAAMPVAPLLTKYSFAAGEGAMTSGQIMSQLEQQGLTPSEAAPYALGAGLTTGAFGAFGKTFAQRAGLEDLEAAIAGAPRTEVARNGLAAKVADLAAKPGFPGYATRLGGGVLTEGLVEEFPQSFTEQMWQNAASGQDLFNGALQQAIEGGLAGAGMGGGFNLIHRNMPAPEPTVAPPAPGPTVAPTTPPSAPVDLTGGGAPTVPPAPATPTPPLDPAQSAVLQNALNQATILSEPPPSTPAAPSSGIDPQVLSTLQAIAGASAKTTEELTAAQNKLQGSKNPRDIKLWNQVTRVLDARASLDKNGTPYVSPTPPPTTEAPPDGQSTSVPSQRQGETEIQADADAAAQSGETAHDTFQEGRQSEELLNPTVPAEPAPVRGFTTARGSTYVVHDDGTTTRNKSHHPEHDAERPGDVGEKERSTKTWYVSPEGIAALNPAGLESKWRVVDMGDGTLSLATLRGDGRWGISPSAKNVPVSSDPQVGLQPFEVWEPSELYGRAAYGGAHPGNAITEITSEGSTPTPGQVPTPAPPPAPPASVDGADVGSENERVVGGAPTDVVAAGAGAAQDLAVSPELSQRLQNAVELSLSQKSMVDLLDLMADKKNQPAVADRIQAYLWSKLLNKETALNLPWVKDNEALTRAIQEAPDNPAGLAKQLAGLTKPGWAGTGSSRADNQLRYHLNKITKALQAHPAMQALRSEVAARNVEEHTDTTGLPPAPAQSSLTGEINEDLSGGTGGEFDSNGFEGKSREGMTPGTTNTIAGYTEDVTPAITAGSRLWGELSPVPFSSLPQRAQAKITEYAEAINAIVSPKQRELYARMVRKALENVAQSTPDVSRERTAQSLGRGTGEGQTSASEARSLPAPSAETAPEAPPAAEGPGAEGVAQRGVAPVQNPTTSESFTETVQSVLGRGTNWRLHVYPTAQDVPAEVLQGVDDSGGTYGWVRSDAKGTKHAYFILDRVEAGTELGKFLHEVGAHIGLENILNAAQYAQLVNQVKTWAAQPGNALEARIARQAISRVSAAQTDASQHDAELLAYFIEESVAAGVNPTAMGYKTALDRWFRTLWAAFKTALRRLGIRNADRLTAQNVVDLAYGAARLELTGHWHGTAAEFRRFNHEFMGSGEGAQAYGWGTYLAKRHGIAKAYMDADVRRKAKEAMYAPGEDFVFFDGKPIAQAYQDAPDGTPEKVILEAFDNEISGNPHAQLADLIGGIDEILKYIVPDDQVQPALAWLRDNDHRFSEKQPGGEGSLFRVDVNVRPEETMHWDLPLSEQPQEVQDALIKAASVEDDDGRLVYSGFLNVPGVGYVDLPSFDTPASELYARIVSVEKADDPEEWERYAHTSSKAASMFLDSIGIKGMEHWDRPSRQKAGVTLFTVPPSAVGLPVEAYLGHGHGELSGEIVDIKRVRVASGRAMADIGLREWVYLSDLYAKRYDPTTRLAPSTTNNRITQKIIQAVKAANDSAQRNLSTNLVVFNDRNIHTVGRAPGGDLSRVQYGKLPPVGQMATNFWDHTKDQSALAWIHHGLVLFTPDQIAQKFGTPAFLGVKKVLDAIVMFSNKRLVVIAGLEKPWAQLSKVKQQTLSRVMGESRVFQYNPTTAPKTADEQRIQALYNTLGADGQKVYQDVHAFWQHDLKLRLRVVRKFRDDVASELKENSRLPGGTKKVAGTEKLLENLNDLLANAPKVYFPFMRYGDYHVVAMSARYKELFDRAAIDEPTDPNRLTVAEEKELRALGQDPNHYFVKGVNWAYQAKAERDRLAALPAFAGDNPEQRVYFNHNAVHPAVPAMSGLAAVGRFREKLTDSGLSDEAISAAMLNFQQTMFELLPEGHILKSGLKAKLAPGYEEDMRAVFARTARSSAHALARLFYTQNLATAMRELKKSGDHGNQEGKALYNAMMTRTSALMQADDSPLARVLHKISAFSLLGASPAFLVVNLHQIPLVTLPRLAAEYAAATKLPWTQAGKLVTRALLQAFKETKSGITWTTTAGKGGLMTGDSEGRVEFDHAKMNHLAPKEQRYLRHLDKLGQLGSTMEMYLSAESDTGFGRLRNITRTLNTPVQAGEIMNRSTAGLAAFRLGMAMYQGDAAKATEFADQIVKNTQVNYAASNAPQFMLGGGLISKPLAHLVFQFWKYRQQMLFNTFDAIQKAYFASGISDEEKRAARLAWKGQFALTMLTAGIFEAPLISGGLGAASLLAGLGVLPAVGGLGVAGMMRAKGKSTTAATVGGLAAGAALMALGSGGAGDDEPPDFERDIRNFLADAIGPEAAEIASKGIWSLVGLDLSKRLGMGDLANPVSFAKFTGSSGRDDAAAGALSFFGAPGSVAADWVQGIYELGDGEYRKAFTDLVPLKGIKDLLRAYGVWTEGLTTKTGEVVKGPESFSTPELLARAAGFQPLKMTRYYEGNSAVQTAFKHVTSARKKAIGTYAQAVLAGDDLDSALERIRQFNESHPEKTLRITGETLHKAVQTRRKLAAERGISGVDESKQLRPFLAQGRFANIGE